MSKISSLSRQMKIGGAVVIVAVGVTLGQATAVTVTVPISAQIVAPGALTLNSGMNFGSVVTPNNGSPSVYSMNCASNIVVTGSGNGSTISSSQSAEFAVTGGANSSYQVTATVGDFSSSDLLLDTPVWSANTGGTYSGNPVCDANAKTVTADSNGIALVRVGARLTVNSGAASGSYTDGTVTVTVVQQ